MENTIKTMDKIIIKALKAGAEAQYDVTSGVDIYFEDVNFDSVEIVTSGNNLELTFLNHSKITLIGAVGIENNIFIDAVNQESLTIADLLKLSNAQLEVAEPAAGPQNESSGSRFVDLFSFNQESIDIPSTLDGRQEGGVSVNNVTQEISPFVFARQPVVGTNTQEALISNEPVSTAEVFKRPVVEKTIPEKSEKVVDNFVEPVAEEPVEEVVYNQVTGINGTSDNRIAGGQGEDRLYGDKGNDILVYDSADSLINGGQGIDTLKILDDSSIRLDKGKTIKKVEVIDLDNDLENEITLTEKDVLKTSDNKILQILGDALDSVDAPDFNDRGVDINIGETTFATFTSGKAQLYVELGITMNNQILTDIII